MDEGIDWRHRGEYIAKHGLTPGVADEAFADPNRLVIDPDPASVSGRTIRVIGWSSSTGALVTVIVLACMPTVSRLLSADSSASSARLRIAEVKRGNLTRDVSVQGSVVAAVRPTLYAANAGTVSLLVNAGDKVKKDDVLAEVVAIAPQQAVADVAAETAPNRAEQLRGLFDTAREDAAIAPTSVAQDDAAVEPEANRNV